MAGASGRSPGRGRPGQHLHLSALRPRRAFIPRGRSPDRAGRAHRPGLRGRWASRGVLARSHPVTDPRRNARDTAGVTDALWPAQPRRSTTRNAQEWRAIETVLSPPGRGDPMALLVAARAVCRSCCRTVGRTWASWMIRHVPVNRACVPGLIPRLAQNCTRAPTNRPRSIEPGHNPGDADSTPLMLCLTGLGWRCRSGRDGSSWRER